MTLPSPIITQVLSYGPLMVPGPHKYAEMLAFLNMFKGLKVLGHIIPVPVARYLVIHS